VGIIPLPKKKKKKKKKSKRLVRPLRAFSTNCLDSIVRVRVFALSCFFSLVLRQFGIRNDAGAEPAPQSRGAKLKKKVLGGQN